MRSCVTWGEVTMKLLGGTTGLEFLKTFIHIQRDVHLYPLDRDDQHT